MREDPVVQIRDCRQLTLRKDIIMPLAGDSNCLRKEREDSNEVENNLPEGITIECICPKCGIGHKMKLLWSGRGTPKKFCPPCKSFVSTLEALDSCRVPADIHRGMEKAV
jgi:hypothetical protein